ncbi:hypothetical protein LTR66_017121, partial [Elasticomyces elasticus]
MDTEETSQSSLGHGIRLLDLPAEIQHKIYACLFIPFDLKLHGYVERKAALETDGESINYDDLACLRVCHLMHDLAKPALLRAFSGTMQLNHARAVYVLQPTQDSRDKLLGTQIEIFLLWDRIIKITVDLDIPSSYNIALPYLKLDQFPYVREVNFIRTT